MRTSFVLLETKRKYQYAELIIDDVPEGFWMNQIWTANGFRPDIRGLGKQITIRMRRPVERLDENRTEL